MLWTAGSLIVLSVVSVALLRVVPPWTSAFMIAARIEAWRDGDRDFHVDYRWTPYASISPHVKLAVISSEDQKFAFHDGFDFDAIDQALKERERGKRVRGASTITQQVAKNLFLWSGQSFVRKGIEAYFAFLIELLWPKQRILEVYLNVAEFGPGIYGVGAAAPRMFHKEPARLNAAESALLAAVLPSPKRLHADHPSAYVLRRQSWILGQMEMLGGSRYIHGIERTTR